MKRLTTLTLLSLISPQTFAYELVNFSSSRVRTADEILTETNKTYADLTAYSCDNPDRMELFAQTTIQNMAQDSLKIVTKTNDIFTYQNGELFDQDGKPLSKIKDKFAKIALKTLARLETVPETRQLIKELQYSPYPFYIKLGGNRYTPNNLDQRSNLHGNDAGFISMMDDLRPMVDGMPFSQIGFGGQIHWHPNIKSDFVEVDYKKRFVDKDLVLAHEMYHAYDGMRGLLDRRFIKSDEYEFQPVCEYRAVRLENAARKGLGYKYRRYYSDPHTDRSPKDMLDDNDEPIVIPTPCIKWL